MKGVAWRLGATPLGGGRCEFVVWAPRAKEVEVHVIAPAEKWAAMEPLARGYYRAAVDGAGAGARYRYRLEGKNERPDPVSRSQPEGPHGPSQVIAPAWEGWEDTGWRGLPLADCVFYELHVGAFTREGTFDAIIPRLDALKQLGVTAIELMPVAQFPGTRNWGYDGTYLYAPQDSYGGPEGLKRLVNECHRRGMAVALDVVYNHLGPEGNYLHDYGPYFSERYRTPWGEAMNFDGADSDEVRRFFVDNALEWVTDYHIDGLRLDAIHAILDMSPYPFLAELGDTVHRRAAELGREILVIPESERNDARFVERPERGGCGLDAQWEDDFHHALHVLLTGEKSGYYGDFHPESRGADDSAALGAAASDTRGVRGLARAMKEGYVYQGEYSAYRRRRHGNSPRAIPAERLVVFAQNHDQIGNRMEGERLAALVDFESLKLAAGAVLLSPFVPLLFMGEEYGETAPFQYFVSHTDAALIEAVRKGRREEFARFRWQGEAPDPQAEATFARCRLNWELRQSGHHAVLLELHRELLRLRRELPALRKLDKAAVNVSVSEQPPVLLMRRGLGAEEIFAVLNFHTAPAQAELPAAASRESPRAKKRWQKVLDSADDRWRGPGSALPAVLDAREDVMIEVRPRSFVLFT
ncbi:MAG: malto-oligosyltrehalose trehalohydrolase [Candidatus Acidiferrales bacterium]